MQQEAALEQLDGLAELEEDCLVVFWEGRTESDEHTRMRIRCYAPCSLTSVLVVLQAKQTPRNEVDQARRHCSKRERRAKRQHAAPSSQRRAAEASDGDIPLCL